MMVEYYVLKRKSFPSNKFVPNDLKRQSYCNFFPNPADMPEKPEEVE